MNIFFSRITAPISSKLSTERSLVIKVNSSLGGGGGMIFEKKMKSQTFFQGYLLTTYNVD